MSTILIILVLIFLFGGGAYYAHDHCGGTALGSVLGLLLVVVVVLQQGLAETPKLLWRPLGFLTHRNRGSSHHREY